MRSKYLEARLNLDLAKKNIQRIKQISALTGISYCCIGALESRQKELEVALNNPVRSPVSPLGLIPAIVGGVVGVAAAVTTIIGLVKAAAWHKQTTDVELAKQENIKYAMENGIDPSTFCPPAPPSPTDKLINTVKGAIVLGMVALVFVYLTKQKIIKGVFK